MDPEELWYQTENVPYEEIVFRIIGLKREELTDHTYCYITMDGEWCAVEKTDRYSTMIDEFGHGFYCSAIEDLVPEEQE